MQDALDMYNKDKNMTALVNTAPADTAFQKQLKNINDKLQQPLSLQERKEYLDTYLATKRAKEKATVSVGTGERKQFWTISGPVKSLSLLLKDIYLLELGYEDGSNPWQSQICPQKTNAYRRK